jgi:hypothetical protein
LQHMYGSDNYNKCLVVEYICDFDINSMEQSPSLEAGSSSPSEAITHILWNPEVHYHVHKRPPLVSVLYLIHSTPFHPICLRYILILPSVPSVELQLLTFHVCAKL